ncbi:MAG: hypothetical protein ACXWCS_29650 [Burkholderiales bacterium]
MQAIAERHGWPRTIRVRRSTVRHAEHALLQALLSGALLSPIIAAMVGWADTDLRHLSLPAYLGALLGIAAAIASPHYREQQHHPLKAYMAALGAMIAASVCEAFILERNANAFYTVPSLMDGIIALLVLYAGSRVQRWYAVRYRANYLILEPTVSGAASSRGVRRSTPAEPMLGFQRVTLPAVALADALASVSAWSMLAFWVLVALEHRHVASGILVFTGGLLVLACFVLIPDTLAARGVLPRGLDTEDDAPDSRPHA